jgi:hypothetical protein
MRSSQRWLRPLRKSLVVAIVALLCVGGGLAYALSKSSGSNDQNDPSAAVSGSATANVSQSTVGQIPSGYLGLSFEIRGIESYTGTDPHAINPVFEQLIRNLDPGQRPVLRLGGDSTDWSWYPYRKGPHPVGVRYTIPASWFSVIKSLAEGVDAHLILGVNLEQDSAAVARAEADAFESKIGSQWIEALALGNEPELYHGLVWFSLHGVKYYGRPASWNFQAYLKNYAQIVSAMPKTELAGPDIGGPSWEPSLGSFLASEPRVKIAAIHRYPLKYCASSEHVSVGQLLSNSSTRGYAAGLSGLIRAAHAHGAAFRLDEMNSVSCGGLVGVSNTFAAGLWALDAMFELAHAGVDGVNVHTREVPNQLFTFSQSGGQWRGVVEPDYYGLLAFAQAAPAGSKLLNVSGFSSGPIHVWATRAPDGTERVVLINMASSGSETINVKIQSSGTTGTLERLTAPGLSSTGHVTLGGQSFATNTTTGQLSGAAQTTTVAQSNGGYAVTLPAASAAILTLPAS